MMAQIGVKTSVDVLSWVDIISN